jgi:hypothetical protein
VRVDVIQVLVALASHKEVSSLNKFKAWQPGERKSSPLATTNLQYSMTFCLIVRK